MTSKEKAIVKFNSSYGAILCSCCNRIVKTGKDYSEEESKYSRGELDHLDPRFCESCSELKAEIEKRYGSFELSHDKNKEIVMNILKFVTNHKLVKDYWKKNIYLLEN